MGRKRTRLTQPTPFGERILALREKRGLTRDEIGQRAEVSKTYIGMLESGERQPSREMVLKLGQAFYPEGNQTAWDDLLLLAGFSPLSPLPPEQHPDVIERLELALAEQSDNFKTFSALVISLIRQGHHDQAQARLQAGFQSFSERVKMQALLAMLELSKGRCEDALSTQQFAISLYQQDPAREPGVQLADLKLNLGTMHFIYAYEQLANNLPESALISFAQAREILAEAARLAPQDVYILDEYARACFNLAYAQNGQAEQSLWQDTISAFNAVLGLESKQSLGLPMLKEASAFLALAYAKCGQMPEAELSLRLLTTFCPHYWLLNYVEACCLCLGYATDPDPQRLDKALLKLEQAASLPDPHNRTRSEAPHDPDLEPLRQHRSQAFQHLFSSPSNSNSPKEISV